MRSVNKAEGPVHTELLAIAMQKNGWTSTHSSRMRTARLLTVSHSIQGGEGSAQGGGVCLGGCLPRRGCLPGGCVSQHAMGQTPPPPVDRMTDRCKNTTLPQTSFECGKNLPRNG